MSEVAELSRAIPLKGRQTLLSALLAIADGDFSRRLSVSDKRSSGENSERFENGIDAELAAAFNAAFDRVENNALHQRETEERLRQIERRNEDIETKARQLALRSRYKSEFFANMSHKLRTPLNSLLILAKLLADNIDQHLSPKQVDYAQTIYSAGTDLLALLDDVLDLAKIESGTVVLDIDAEPFRHLHDHFLPAFRSLAQEKGLSFSIDIDKALPPSIRTDGKRLRQILYNLLANAFKFTRHGGVRLEINALPGDVSGMFSGSNSYGIADDDWVEWVEFAVIDSGVGIPKDKQKNIFEAFFQADGAIDREFGGTGLSLSICRELARLLNGEISVTSEPGKSSRFSLRLPLTHALAGDDLHALEFGTADVGGAMEVADTPQTYYGRKSRRSDESLVLIAEGDPRLAALMLGVARSAGYQSAVAADIGSMWVLLRKLKPDAVLLGATLADADCWAVLELIRQSPDTCALPINVSWLTQHANKSLSLPGNMLPLATNNPGHAETLAGALGALLGLAVQGVLVGAVDHTPGQTLLDHWKKAATEAVPFATTAELVRLLDAEHRISAGLKNLTFDGVLFDTGLDELVTLELLSSLFVAGTPPDMALAMPAGNGAAELAVLRSRPTLEGILESTVDFLRRLADSVPPPRQESPNSRRRAGAELSGRKVLIVDNDVRNIYVLTGALEQSGMIVIHAENGIEGIERLQSNPDTDAVLMDIMMPEPDGYETMRMIRTLDEYKKIPIIAVTAHARPDDREKSILAGASDYIAKPVNVEQLLALLRAWLTQKT